MTAEITYFGYATSMWQEMPEVRMSAPEATHLMAVLTACYTGGRIFTAVISFFKLIRRPDLILSYHFAVIIFALAGLYFGRLNSTIVYLATAALGYGFSACWPSMFAFTETHLKLTDRVASLYSFLVGVVGLVVPLVLGQTFNAHPKVLLLLEAIFIGLSITFFATVRLLILFSGELKR